MSRSTMVRLGLLALLWGSSFLWIAVALRGFPPIQVVLARIVLGALAMLVMMLALRQRLPRSLTVWGHLTVAAMLGNTLPFLFYAYGEQQVSSGVAGTLNATTPLWTILVSFLTGYDRRMSAGRLAGIAVGFTGTLLIFSPWESGSSIASWGGLACLGAALCYGMLFIYLHKFLVHRGLSPVVLSAGQLMMATVITAAVTPLLGWELPDLRTDAIVSVAILGVFCTGFAYVLHYRLVTDIGPTAAVVTYLMPIVAVVLGAVKLGEAVTPQVIAGMVVVLAGVALVRRDTGSGPAGAGPEVAGEPAMPVDAPTRPPDQRAQRRPEQPDAPVDLRSTGQ